MEFIEKTLINKGWSNDKKYFVMDKKGEKYLIRESNLDQFDKKCLEFNLMKKVDYLGVPICKPIELNKSSSKVYSIQIWIEGRDAEEAISTCSDEEKYFYGIEAGRYLRKIHSIEAPGHIEDWETNFNQKMDRKIKNYLESPIKHEKGQVFIDYIEKNRHLLKDRPQSFQHGDYHIGNMMIGDDKKLYIIDFEKFDFGDPWEEFNRIVWSAQKYPLFASGIVKGYFNDQVPELFWKLMALYIASNTLSSIPWAISYGQEQVNIMLKQADDVLYWYDNMKNTLPKWYVTMF